MYFALGELGLSKDAFLWGIDYAEVVDMSWAAYEKNTGKTAPWSRSMLDMITDIMMEG
jgi:uncharacterized SAM-dependent methyltransferase